MTREGRLLAGLAHQGACTLLIADRGESGRAGQPGGGALACWQVGRGVAAQVSVGRQAERRRRDEGAGLSVEIGECERYRGIRYVDDAEPRAPAVRAGVFDERQVEIARARGLAVVRGRLTAAWGSLIHHRGNL